MSNLFYRYQNVCLYGDDVKMCCSPDDYQASSSEPISFIQEFCEGKPRVAKEFKLLWTKSYAQISHLAVHYEKDLFMLEGDDAFAIANMVGDSYNAVDNPLIKAFDSNKNRDEKSVFISSEASDDEPQGVEIKFETIQKVHEITIVPRGTTAVLLNR